MGPERYGPAPGRERGIKDRLCEIGDEMEYLEPGPELAALVAEHDKLTDEWRGLL